MSRHYIFPPKSERGNSKNVKSQFCAVSRRSWEVMIVWLWKRLSEHKWQNADKELTNSWTKLCLKLNGMFLKKYEKIEKLIIKIRFESLNVKYLEYALLWIFLMNFFNPLKLTIFDIPHCSNKMTNYRAIFEQTKRRQETYTRRIMLSI